MQLPMIQTSLKELQLLESQWKSILDPILGNPILSGRLITDIALVSGNNTVSHKLGRALQGYIVTDMTGAFVNIYRVESPNPTLTLVLNSSGAATIGLMVF